MESRTGKSDCKIIMAKKYPYKKGSTISRKEALELYEIYLRVGTYAAVRREINGGRCESAIGNAIKVLMAEEKTGGIVIIQR